MINAQNTHLRATAGACALYRGARLVEHIDVAARPRGHGRCAFNSRAAWANARKIVAYAAATAHSFSRLTQGFVDTGKAIGIVALNAVAHWLHKTID